ncbi:hypothetical protein V7x_40870 [Crateriforma conspicua]|uniref:DUF3102 domain-containing protein n=1 Tax=Crateriforma conspicua TaxID=2527996 RepID=A0A5C6FNW3_9PLAN|nr:DUF3102 domain-containing protein [Crateriforma conspicua]TWU62358.1 hypothetical protein V7x_40870 [Crateriforma conspicua]
MNKPDVSVDLNAAGDETALTDPAQAPPESCGKTNQEQEITIEQQSQSMRSKRLRRLEAAIVAGQQEIRQLFAASVARAIRIGDCLIEVKQLLNHGEFEKWHQNNLVNVCGMSLRTAQRYMRLARKKDELVDRARSFYSSKKLIPFDDEQLLSSLKINQAVNLLSLPPADDQESKRTVALNDQDKNASREDAYAETLSELTEHFFQLPSVRLLPAESDANERQSNQVNANSANAPLMMVVGGTKPSDSWLEQIRGVGDAYDSVGRIIALPASAYPDWLHHLDKFPRVYLRDHGERQSGKAAVACVVGILPPTQFGFFVDTFAHLGAAFIPASPSDNDGRACNSLKEE